MQLSDAVLCVMLVLWQFSLVVQQGQQAALSVVKKTVLPSRVSAWGLASAPGHAAEVVLVPGGRLGNDRLLNRIGHGWI